MEPDNIKGGCYNSVTKLSIPCTYTCLKNMITELSMHYTIRPEALCMNIVLCIIFPTGHIYADNNSTSTEWLNVRETIFLQETVYISYYDFTDTP